MSNRSGRRQASIETRVALLEQETGFMREMLAEMKEFNRKVAESFTLLARLEEQGKTTAQSIQDIFDKHDEQSRRVGLIERALPGLQEKSTWVTAGVLAIVGAIGLTLLKEAIFPASPKALTPPPTKEATR